MKRAKKIKDANKSVTVCFNYLVGEKNVQD